MAHKLYSSVVFLFFSQGSSNAADNWNGFESKSFEKSKENNVSRKPGPTASADFDSFDVKSSKPRNVSKTKKIEDDAWDLLNN